MMRKKQISRMLIGALAVCLATACSNETDVLTGLRTDGNTLSVNLQTTDVGVTTRTQIASDRESNVESLSAYLFDNNEESGYQLEKIYNNLTWNENDPAHTVALTGIAKRGPKKVYFVANGGSITALGNVGTGISETDFKALLMNEMKENPATPLTMTAEAELAEWIEGANNVTIQKTVQLKRVSARIDLVVAPQVGLTFTVKDIKMKSRANSYLFPNDAPYTGEDVVELTGTAGEGSTDADGNTAYTSLLYPYETPGGVVTEVEVSGNVQAGEVTKEVTFAVPFTNETYADGIPIERNHRYTVQIARIDGFYSAEATITVSDWSTGEASGNLLAGEELKMTATEEISGQLSDEPTATVVYPTDDSKTATVELAADDAKIYKIYVGSANIEAVTSWGELPDGWTIAEPVSTRTEYLWEKSYWTLTISANETDAVKSVTIKAVNKLEKDDTDEFVQITFTQAGKEEVVDHSKNPLLKWAKTNLQRTAGTSGASVTNEFAASIYDDGSYYQFGRNHGFNSYQDARTNYGVYSSIFSSGNVYDGAGYTCNLYSNKTNIANYPEYFFVNNTQDYWPNGTSQSWDNRAASCGYKTANPCPVNWRLPTTEEYAQIMPTTDITSTTAAQLIPGGTAEIRTLSDGTRYAIRWEITKRSSSSSVDYFLEIKSLVVAETVAVEAVDWADENVVTRYFKGTGYILPYSYAAEVYYRQTAYATYYAVGYRYGYSYLGVHNIATPIPFGSITLSTYQAGNSVYVGFSDISDKGNITGNYWTSDATQACMSWRYDVGNTMQQGSWIRKSTTFDKPVALPIRCVTDNPDLQQK